ncbi:MAG: putative porin [Candidatus Omnitrophica bacterium]|nr:putative porin [Candidatus Omnitrophota bacterium]
MKSKLFPILAASVLVLFSLTSVASADEAMLMNMLETLQKQVAQMQRTIDQQSEKIRMLERREPSLQIPGVQPAAAEAAPPMSDYEFGERLGNALGGANKWLKDLKFGGDLRLRYEGFDYTNGTTSETDPQNRFRYRLRYGFEKKFNEDMKIGFAMASGQSSNGVNVDPTSTNSSFDNLFNYDDIFIEKAYGTYTPGLLKGKGPIQDFEITAGKFTNPFERGSSDMVWDRDVKPEGIYERVNLKLLDTSDFDLSSYFTAGQFVLDEDSTVGGDSELFAYQLGLNPVVYVPFMERPVELLSAVSFYSSNDYAVRSNWYIGTTSLARGNSICTSANLCSEDFEVWDYYNEIAFYPFGLPVRPFIDYATNAADNSLEDEDNAWAMGIKLGSMVKKGDWELSYTYKRIGPESVVGAFNDSDFGTGHNGKRGSVFKAGFALTDTISVNAAAFFVNNLTTGLRSPGATGVIRDEEQRRFQIDLNWKF